MLDKSVLDKKLFYERWKAKMIWSDTKRQFVKPKFRDVNTWIMLKDNIDLHISWQANYALDKFNVFSAQLLDMSKSGSHRQICKDLIIQDLWEAGLTSDYKLYKYLDQWVTNEINAYYERGKKGVFE